MAGGDVFGQLLKLLREPVSPVLKLRRLAGSAGAISRLGPRERAVLLRMTGLRGAEALIDRLAAGDRDTQRALHRLLHRVEEEPDRMADTVRALGDPRRRTEAVAALVDALDDALEEESGEEPEEEPRRGAEPAGGEEAAPEGETAAETGTEPPEEEPMPVFAPVPSPRTAPEPASPPGPAPPLAVKTAGAPPEPLRPPPRQAPPTPPETEPQAEPEPEPATTSEPEPALPPEPPEPPPPAPPSVWEEPSWTPPPLPGPTHLDPGVRLGSAAGLAAAAGVGTTRAPEPPPPSPALERPAADAVLDRLGDLHRRLQAGRPMALDELADLLEHDLPYPWARRRALQAWIAAACPDELAEGLDTLLDLVAELPGPAQRSWCLTALAAARPWSGDEWQRITAAAQTPALRRRLAIRRRQA